jgi:hypothetical protein
MVREHMLELGAGRVHALGLNAQRLDAVLHDLRQPRVAAGPARMSPISSRLISPDRCQYWMMARRRISSGPYQRRPARRDPRSACSTPRPGPARWPAR